MKRILFILLALPFFSIGQVKNYVEMRADTVRIKKDVTPSVGNTLVCIDTFGDYVTSYGTQYLRDSISSTRILTSHSHPDTIVVSPGAGKQIQVLSEQWKYVYGTIPYSDAHTDLFQGDTINGLNGNAGSTYGIGHQLENASSPISIKISPGQAYTQNGQDNSLYNAPIVFYTTDQNPSDGDGYLILTLVYIITP